VQTAALIPLVGPTPQAAQAPAHFAPATPAAVAPPAPRPGTLGTLPAETAQPATVYQTAAVTSAPITTESVAPRQPHPRGPWIIQVGAFPKETEAKDRLREAQSLAKSMLAKADPFTERFVKGNQEYYRARFAGFDQHGAEAVCKYFKRNDIACLATRN
jgi:D-alanyl-D-alanine carboxypeptidase